ncbi:MAG: AAA family ATPase [Candidatus Scalindua sp.]|mgnify:CR=1 FL=1|jgi:ATP-dependent helicase/nuclease subunit B|nr:AAA family ATPase [Candidatus Scalindua sp.]MBT5304783.1 AAA family ATPase [Candidatus Scalindua sp.]MBT6048939.1 AAA family ATPase [Candidatus Scalindua sp.]MBT6231158.1 AAA family ATPase [Candidatus Scalindua sp.]MBT6562342.1 AAA family ATPase [Candidatus Scalindua sp.]
MQERFLVLGKAGSGKTHFVLQKFFHYVGEHKEDNVIFILPTHSQVEHLRDHILRTSAYKGYLDTGLVTFSGLANRILDHVGNTPQRKPLNESEKDLVLSSILKDDNTGYFSEVSDYAGFKSAFLNFIREIKENSLDPSAFKDVLKTVQTGKKHSPLNLKCNELVKLYDRYQQALKNNRFLDKEDLLAQAQSHLNDTAFSDVELLLVDGFHDYTQLELKFLTRLTSLVPNVYITLPHQTSDPVPPAFRVSHKTYSRLIGLGLKELKLDENRRTTSQMLRHIEANVFSKTQEPVVSESDSSSASLQITVAANMQDEVEQIARRIRKLTYDEGYTFSQIAVIFRNIEKYQDLVEDTFTRFSIPVRIYGKKSLKENPLIKAIMNTISIFTNKWQDEAVWKVLKSNTGIDRNLINTLEQEYLKRGKTDDCNKWLELPSDSELEPVSNFLKQLKEIFGKLEGRHTFSHYCDCVTDIKDMFYETSFTLPVKSIDKVNHNREIIDLMKSDAGALREFLSLLNSSAMGELSRDTGGITFEKFIHILESQVNLTSYKKTDRRKEVVNVINVLEARQWEIPVVFVGGLLEKEFPKQIRENLFLKDYYRSRLNAAGKIVLREACEKMDEERYLFYIAITRAKERLYLSYPSANSNGNLTLPSFFLSDIQKLFSKELRKEITIHRNLSNIIPEPEEIITSTDSKSFVYYHLNTPCVSEREQYGKDVALWLYNNTEDESLFREELCALTALIDSYNNLRIKLSDKGIIKKIGEASRRFSPTKLKDYAQCPYKYFGRSTLKLKQILPKSMDLLMQGIIIHKVLEEYFKDTKDITKIFDDVFKQKTRGMIIGFEELKIKNEMINTLLTFEYKEKESDSSRFKPSLFEAKFGDEEFGTLEIGDNKKEAVEISGKIDRIDISGTNGERIGVIIDYKYGQTEFKITDMEEGLDLQLPIYLLALRDVFKIIPVAAEFYALKSSKKTGIYNQELIDNLSLNIKPIKKSLSVDNKEFNKMLKDAENHILEFTKEIRNGRIELAPANIDFCGEGNCDFANVCRIDKWRVS